MDGDGNYDVSEDNKNDDEPDNNDEPNNNDKDDIEVCLQ